MATEKRAARATRALQPGHRISLLEGGAATVPGAGRGHRRRARRGAARDLHLRFHRARRCEVAEALERAARARRAACAWWSTASAPATCRRSGSARWQAAGVHWRVFNPARGWRVLRPRALAPPAPQAVRGRRPGRLLRRHQHARRLPRPEPRRARRRRASTSRCASSGPLVADMHETMARLWLRMQAAREARAYDFEAALDAVRDAARAGADAGDPELAAGEYSADARAPHDGVLAGLRAARQRAQPRSASSAPTAARSARRASEIIIANAYFVPGAALQRALLRAARRGVRVQLLLQGRYEYFMQYYAPRRSTARCCDAGVEINEYAPSFLHAKVAVVDGRRAVPPSARPTSTRSACCWRARPTSWSDDALRRPSCAAISSTRCRKVGARIEPEKHMKPAARRARPWTGWPTALMRHRPVRHAARATEGRLARRRDLVVQRPEGLYCPPGDFYIDPWRPVDARRDHARARRPRARAATATTWRRRRPKACCARGWARSTCRRLPYGEPIEHHGVRLSLHPAGHVLGSAQVRLEHGGRVWVASGDYYVAGGADGEATRPARRSSRCAATASSPNRPSACRSTAGGRSASCSPTSTPGGAPMPRPAAPACCWATASARRSASWPASTAAIGPIVVHGAVEPLNRAYRAAGVALPPTPLVTEVTDKALSGARWSSRRRRCRARAWMRRFGEHERRLRQRLDAAARRAPAPRGRPRLRAERPRRLARPAARDRAPPAPSASSSRTATRR